MERLIINSEILRLLEALGDLALIVVMVIMVVQMRKLIQLDKSLDMHISLNEQRFGEVFKEIGRTEKSVEIAHGRIDGIKHAAPPSH